MKDGASLKFQKAAEDQSATIGSLSKKFPVSQTAKALVRVTPYQYNDPWIQEAFNLYEALTPAMASVIGIVVMLRIAKIGMLFEHVAKYGELFRDAVSCYFLIGFFPRLFQILSIEVQNMQERILDFHVANSGTTLVELKPAFGVLSILTTLASATFLGPISFLMSGAIAILWALPLVFYSLFHFCFLLGVCLLIFMAPIVIVSATLLGQRIALSFFFWMLISSMIWPLLWAGIGRMAFIGLQDMNLIFAVGYTLGVGLLQCAAPIIFIKMMRGVNPGESLISFGTRLGSTAAGLTMSAPIGALASPVLGAISGARSFVSGARLGGSTGSVGGLMGRVTSGVKAYRETAAAQTKNSAIPSLSLEAGFQPVRKLARVGDHVDRTKAFLKGFSKQSGTSSQKENRTAQGISASANVPLYQNPEVYGLSVRDLTRYGMLRSAEKQANRWHQGTLAFLSAKGKGTVSTGKAVKSSAVKPMLEASGSSQRLIVNEPGSPPIVHGPGWTMHPPKDPSFQQKGRPEINKTKVTQKRTVDETGSSEGNTSILQKTFSAPKKSTQATKRTVPKQTRNGNARDLVNKEIDNDQS